MNARIIAENAFFRVTVDETAKRIVVKRSKTGFPSMEVLRASNAERDGAIAPYANKGFSLLLDARDGPLRNDPAFEAETRKARVQMFEVFSKVAILVRTTVGALQMQRLQRGEPGASEDRVRVFEDDEAAAVALLT
jgi:hypothetical protein